MKIIKITAQQEKELVSYRRLLPLTSNLSITTTAGETFNASDHALLAYMVWKRFGMDNAVFGAVWRNMLSNDCPTEDAMALVAYYILDVADRYITVNPKCHF